tara:strand:+ start:24 stop:422 length:399 start_codon:yes stop_codon:yes gene_type:complete
MSEENTVDAESETPEVSPAENFINAVTAKDYVAASKEFEEMMLGKVDTALEQEKINLAGQIFNGEEPPEEEEEEEDHIENDAEDESDEEAEEESEEDEWDEEESNKRMDVIGQNGNDGLHYDQDDNDGNSPE